MKLTSIKSLSHRLHGAQIFAAFSHLCFPLACWGHSSERNKLSAKQKLVNHIKPLRRREFRKVQLNPLVTNLLN